MSKTEKEMNQLLVEATKYYKNDQFEESCNVFSELNELYYATNNDNNPYYLFLYGRSLYHLAVESSDVFGGAGATGEEDDDEEDEEEEGKDGVEKTEKDKKSALYQFGEERRKEEEEEEQEKEDKEQAQKDQEQEDQEQEDDNDGNDFENAWSVLEISRAMYEEQLQQAEADKEEKLVKDLKLQLSENYDVLGLVSLEMENFKQSKEDFVKCLQYREDVYQETDPTHRLIIEANYKLGMALENDPLEYKECEKYMKKVITLLETRIKEGKGEPDDSELVKDLKEKLEEIKMNNIENENMEVKQLQAMKALLGGAASGTVNVGTEQKVNDLTSMIVKKGKKRSLPVGDEEPGLKKAKK
ncbi:hypothetical protein ACO0QE_002894 [Hanseniaspora vineae]